MVYIADSDYKFTDSFLWTNHYSNQIQNLSTDFKTIFLSEKKNLQ